MKSTQRTPIFIGKLIKDELRKQQRTAVWLADALGCNRSNVYKIFNRHSLDADLLLRISNVLGHDFFQPYTDRLALPANGDSHMIP